MTPTFDLPESLSHGPFRAQTALEEGIGRRELRSTRFVPVVRDVYVARELAGDPWLRYAAVRLLVPRGVFSHDTAARLWRLPLPVLGPDARRPVHVSVPPGALPARIAGVTAHECHLDAVDVATVARPASSSWEAMRLPLTVPMRCFLDVAAGWSLADVVAMGDAALRSQRFDVMTLRHRVETAGGRRGVVRARAAVRLLDARSGGPSHSRLRVLLVVAGLPRPRCSLDLYDPGGGWLACADLAWPEQRLLVAVEPRQAGSDERRRAEHRRRTLVTAAGWDVLALDEAEAEQRPVDVVWRLWRALRTRGWCPATEGPALAAAVEALAAPPRRRVPPRPPYPGPRRSVA